MTLLFSKRRRRRRCLYRRCGSRRGRQSSAENNDDLSRTTTTFSLFPRARFGADFFVTNISKKKKEKRVHNLHHFTRTHTRTRARANKNVRAHSLPSDRCTRLVYRRLCEDETTRSFALLVVDVLLLFLLRDVVVARKGVVKT